MPSIIVTNNSKTISFSIPGVEVVAAKDYLMLPRFSTARDFKVFNICRSYGYQTDGYYVSLLAATRGHKAFPSVQTIQETKSLSVVKIITEDMEDLIQKSLKNIQSSKFSINIYFGKTYSQKYSELGQKIFKQFLAPLLRVDFAWKGREWHIQNIQLISFAEIPNDHVQFTLECAKQYFAGKMKHARRKVSYNYDLAILVNENEIVPPSNKKAIDKFEWAGEKVGFNVDIIDKDDYDRLSEFDALFIRETTYVNHHTFRFSQRAEADGLVVIDDPASILTVGPITDHGDGSYSATLTSTTDIGSFVLVVRALAVTGQAAFSQSGQQLGIGISPGSLNFGSTALGATTQALVVTVTSTGTGPVSIGASTLSGANPGDFRIVSDGCGVAAVLAGGATCQVSVTFTPTTPARAAILQINDSAPGAPHTVALGGSGAGLTLSPASIDFGSVTQGVPTAPVTVTATNNSSGAVTVTSISFIGANSGDFTTTADACTGAGLAGKGTCAFGVIFTPQGAGARSATLSLASSSPDSPATIGVTGTGVALAPAATLSPSAWAFGQVAVGSTSLAETSTLTSHRHRAAVGHRRVPRQQPAAGLRHRLQHVQWRHAGAGPDLHGIGDVHTQGSVRLLRHAVVHRQRGQPECGARRPGDRRPGGTVPVRSVLHVLRRAAAGPGGRHRQQRVVRRGRLALRAGGYRHCFCGEWGAGSAPGRRRVQALPPDVRARRVVHVHRGSNRILPLGRHQHRRGQDRVPNPRQLGAHGRRARRRFWYAGPGSCGVATLLTRYLPGAPPVSYTPDFRWLGTNLSTPRQFFPCAQSSIVTAGPDGTVWLGVTNSPAIPGIDSPTGFMRISTDGVFLDFMSTNPNGYPTAATLGSDGNLYALLGSGSSCTLERFTAAGAMTPVPLGSSPFIPSCYSLTTGPDGLLWLIGQVLSGTSFVGSMVSVDPVSGTVNTYPAPATDYLTAGPDEGIWFNSDPSAVGRFDIGGGPARAFVTPSVVGFPSTGLGIPSGVRTVTVQSTGTGPLTIAGVSLAGTDASQFLITGNFCTGAVLAPGGTCSVNVVSMPNVARSHHATLVIADDDVFAPQVVRFAEYAISPQPQPVPTSVAFPATLVGQDSATTTVTLNNPGDRPLDVTSVSLGGSNPGDFVIVTDHCSGTSVPVGGACTVTVRFRPTAAGTRTATLTFTDKSDLGHADRDSAGGRRRPDSRRRGRSAGARRPGRSWIPSWSIPSLVDVPERPVQSERDDADRRPAVHDHQRLGSDRDVVLRARRRHMAGDLAVGVQPGRQPLRHSLRVAGHRLHPDVQPDQASVEQPRVPALAAMNPGGSAPVLTARSGSARVADLVATQIQSNGLSNPTVDLYVVPATGGASRRRHRSRGPRWCRREIPTRWSARPTGASVPMARASRSSGST